MTKVISTPEGRQVVISSDLGSLRLSLWVNKGSCGLELTKQQAIQVRAALLSAILDIEAAEQK